MASPFLFFHRIIVERSMIMPDMEKQKKDLRKQIISSAIIYKNHLAGKVFLYVYGNNFFEVAYRTSCFKHLTGVASCLPAEEFYNKAKEAELATTQFGFNSQQPYRTAKKKITCLHSLPLLTTDHVCVVKDLSTLTITYKMGITNLEFTVGLTDNLDFSGNKINDWLIPRTLRINDKAFEQSTDVETVDFIFSKGAAEKSYRELCYASKGAELPREFLPMLDGNLARTFQKEPDRSEAVCL